MRYEVGTLHHLLGFDIITHFKLLLLMVLQIGSSFCAGTFWFQARRCTCLNCMDYSKHSGSSRNVHKNSTMKQKDL
jgi:hypothetical protein